MTDTAPASSGLPVSLAWTGVGLLTLSAAASAWIESLLVPLYLGSAIVPVTLLLALAGNWYLPRLARALVPSMVAALLPFLAWLAVVFLLGASGRPEGDVILPGGSDAPAYIAYALMLGGALVGVVSVVTAIPPPAPRAPRRPTA